MLPPRHVQTTRLQLSLGSRLKHYSPSISHKTIFQTVGQTDMRSGDWKWLLSVRLAGGLAKPRPMAKFLYFFPRRSTYSIA